MRKLILIALCLAPFSVQAASENLDEMVARKSRRGVNSFYTGENCTSKGAWNPMTLSYSDATTGAEVWKLTNLPNRDTNAGVDIGLQPWSANGARVGFKGVSNTACFNAYGGAAWFLSDASGVRLAYENSYRGAPYLFWDPSKADTFFAFGSNGMQEGLDNRVLYKHSVGSGNTVSRATLLTFPWSSGMYPYEDMFKNTISADGKKALVLSRASMDASHPVYSVTLSPTPAIDNPTGYTGLSIDGYWGDHPDSSFASIHDMYVGGTASTKVWWYFMPQDGSVGSSWWRSTLLGASGAPVVTQDHTAPYDFGAEMDPIFMNSAGQTEGSCGTSKNPWCCDNDNSTDCTAYMSHFVIDRWGTKITGAYVNGDPCIGFSIFDTGNKRYDNKCIATGSAGHYSWSAWSDWIASSPSVAGNTVPVNIANYKTASVKNVAYPHVRESGGTNYQTLPRVAQSPDGTKLLYHGDFLTGAANALDVYYAVAYYPYPPEIKQAAKNGSNVRLTWDFNQGTAETPNLVNPRTYATRGWPNESTDRPPSPREVKQFRVWSSADNSTWTPLGTTAYNNCSGSNECGAWTEGAWSYDAAQTAGTTKYYAVTSVEHSGLESHTLSNVWKVTLDGGGNVTAQTQHTAYPADPGGKVAFYTAKPAAITATAAHQKAPATTAGQYTVEWSAPADDSLVRHYNIYAKDGGTPTATQQMRIASVPVGTTSYVDWLGDTGGTTQYLVTAVDYQGNESSTTSPTHRSLIGRCAARIR